MVKIFSKYKEQMLYLFFGGLTFIVSIASYSLFNLYFSINELVSNILSWIIAVLFAFFTNRKWVFSAPTNGVKEFLYQMWQFFMGRIVTLIIEEAIIFVFVTVLSFSSIIVKVIAQIIVIVLNYFISKMIVFDKK